MLDENKLEKRMNMIKTGLLLAGLTALLLMIGMLLGGRVGLIIALILAVVMNFSAYWFSDKIVLSMYQAQEINPNDATGLFEIVDKLAKTANIKTPKIYIIDDPQPNAFATGRNPQNASVAVTSGILQQLNSQELTGVLAHELTHVLHRDTLIMTVSATIAGAISMIANMAMWSSLFGGDREEGAGSVIGGILMMFLGPMAAGLIQMAISRSREYAADAGGAKLCGHPLWLASALEKIEQAKDNTYSANSEAHPAMAHLFIINPLHSQKLVEWFSTHPSTSDRIKRLQDMAQNGEYDFS